MSTDPLTDPLPQPTLLPETLALIKALPKVELHLHIEGTLEPEMMFDLAQRNGVTLPYASVDEVRAAYNFQDLQSFLDLYYAGAGVLITEQDFYDLTWAYCQRVAAEGVRHVEIFFDPQTHTHRGVAFETVLNGIESALTDAQSKLNLTSQLILCILRHLPAEDGMKTLEQAKPHKDRIHGIGLDSSEKDFPPSLFQECFDLARNWGWHCVAHAGEEGPPAYIWEALTELHVERIDHGVRCLEDHKLVQVLAQREIPLTVCPLSNIKLCVFDRLDHHNLKELLRQGLCVTINSDDPAYFGGYLTENFVQTAQALELKNEQITLLAHYGVQASFLEPEAKETLHQEIEAIARQYAAPNPA